MAAFEQAATSIEGGPIRSLLWYGDSLWLHLDSRCDWLAAYRVSRLVLSHAERHADRELTAWGLLLHGRSEACLGRLGAGAAALAESLALLRETGNQVGMAIALNGLGVVDSRRGRFSEALSCYRQALEIVRGRDAYLTASVLTNLCQAYAVLGQLDQAESAGKTCLATSPGTKGHVSAMINLASVYCMRGDYAEAVRLLDEAIPLNGEVGDGLRTCESLITRSEANRLRGDLAGAAADAEQALSKAEVWGYRSVAAAALRQRARILTAMGREREAVHAQTLADEAYAQLGGTSRDLLTEFFLADDEQSWRGRLSRGHRAPLVPRGPEAAHPPPHLAP